MKALRIVFVVVVLMMLAGMATADVPRTISYQGKVTDSSGNPVPDADYQVRFYLYNQPTAGTALWMEAFFTIQTTDGLFTHLLGSRSPIPDSLFANYDSLYLAVMFNFEWLTPRTPLATSGYSFRVNSVDGASGGTITGNLTLDAVSGNSSLALPEDAIGRLEIYDEPGISQSVVDTNLAITSSNFIDLVTLEITIPRSGYIILYGKAVLSVNPDAAVFMQIDQTSGGHASITDVSYARIHNSSNTEQTWATGNCHRVYYKGLSGTYTFRLEAALAAGDYSTAMDKVLTAIYIPTSYGTVETILSSEELGDLAKLHLWEPVTMATPKLTCGNWSSKPPKPRQKPNGQNGR